MSHPSPQRPLPAWDPAADDAFVCTAVRRASATMTTLVLAPRLPSTIAFDAGQYVTVEFDLDGEAVNRCYTLSSPPTRPERLEISVGRRPGGIVSPRLGEGVVVGSVVRVGPPQGAFTMREHPADSYLLLTAGSGITPALAMLRELYDLGRDFDIVLVHGQRQPDQIAFRAELDRIALDLPRVRVHFVCSGDSVTDPGVRCGRIDASVLSELVPDLEDREVFVCGPDAFRGAMRGAVGGLGGDLARVHEETFSFADAGDVADVLEDPADPDVTDFTVEFRHLGVTIVCPPGTTVLSAAAAAGLTVPSSCGEGLCGTCKHTLAGGEVDMQHAGGIRPREIANGKVLLCCSRPLSDLVVTAQ